jgi:hypothetical protein
MAKRIDLDKNIKAKSIEQASKKFAEFLTKKGYEWAGEEMIESVENGYYCCSNAMLHNIGEGKVTSPETHDWTYYWAIENVDGNEYYAWFIEREVH